MRTHFAEVLALESVRLAGVTDAVQLAGWRRRVVEELMTPRSPYVLALRETGDLSDRAEFISRWRGLIAATLERLSRSRSTSPSSACSAGRSRATDLDTHRSAVLILAALHGGSALSQVTRDPSPLNAALDLALAPFTPPETDVLEDTATG
jgi:hypothetical protein